MKKEIICIVCPRSCRLQVEQTADGITVEGHGCKRGIAHGENEFLNPMRLLTSTVTIKEGILSRLPVVGSEEIPKNKMKSCLQEVYSTAVTAPVTCGDIIIENICDTGADIIASRSMKRR